MHVEIYEGRGLQPFRFRFKNKGRITAVGEGHPTRSNATRAAKAIVRGVLGTERLIPKFWSVKIPKKPGVVEIHWIARGA